MPDNQTIDFQARALVEQVGIYEAARRLGLNYVTLTRVIAGLGVRTGTRAQIALVLGLGGPAGISAAPSITA